MNFQDIRTRRAALGYSVPMLAEVLRVEQRMLRDWENGSIPIPDWVEHSMDALTTARANPREELPEVGGTFASRQNKLLWARVQESIARKPSSGE